MSFLTAVETMRRSMYTQEESPERSASLEDLERRASFVFGAEKPPKPTAISMFRNFCLRWTQSSRFRIFIFSCILLNNIAMALQYYGQTTEYGLVLEAFNFAFLIIFILEARIKIIGLGFRRYISDNWNKFDFVLVAAGSIALLYRISVSGSNFLLDASTAGGVGTGFTTILRVFR